MLQDPRACKCINGTCVKPTVFKYVKCHSDSDCGKGTNGICSECNVFTGERSCGLPDSLDECADEWDDANDCYERKKCAPVPGSAIATCVQEQCTAETNDLLSCRTTCATYRDTLKKCAAQLIVRNCPWFPMWARIVTAFSILLFAVLIIVTLYGISLLTTKKKYGRIRS